MLTYSDEYLVQLSRNLENAQEGLNDNVFDSMINADFLDGKYLAKLMNGSSNLDELTLKRMADRVLASDSDVKALALVTVDGADYYLEEHNESFDSDSMLEMTRRYKDKSIVIRSIEDGYLLQIRPLYDLSDTSLIGHLSLIIDDQYLRDEFRYSSKYQEWHILVLDTEHQLLTYEDQLSRGLFEHLKGSTAREGKVQQVFEWEGKPYIANTMTSPKRTFRVMNIIPYDSVTETSKRLMQWIILIGLGALLINLIIATFISRGFSRNIHLLVNRIRDFKEGDFATRIELRSKDEIGIIAEEFNEMAEEINTLVNKVYHEQLVSEKAKKEALRFEYDALQAKMNPHFLYNVLESVNSMAKMEGKEDISEVVCLLGELLRDSIRDERETVYLEDELDYAQRYIRLKELTNRNTTRVTYEIDEILLGALVPKFILQPIVENAFVHGLKNLKKQGELTIGASYEDSRLKIWIRDNGRGFGPEKRRLSVDHTDKWQRTRIGLKSIDKRLKILYGEEAGVRIESNSECTEVTLIMSYKTEAEYV